MSLVDGVTQDTFLSLIGSTRLTTGRDSAVDVDADWAGIIFRAAALRCSSLGGAIVDFAAGQAVSARKCLTGDLDRDSLGSMPGTYLSTGRTRGLDPG